MNSQIVLISVGVLIAIIVIVFVLFHRKSEKFSSDQGSSVLTSDTSGNIKSVSSLSLTSLDLKSLDVDGGLTLKQNPGNTGSLIMSTGRGSNPIWQPGFLRFIGIFPTTFAGQTINQGNTIISGSLTNLIPGNTLLVKCIVDIYSNGGGGYVTTQAQLSGGDNSLGFSSPSNTNSYTTIHFVGTIQNINSGSSTTLSLVNAGNTSFTLYNSTSVLEVYEYSS